MTPQVFDPWPQTEFKRVFDSVIDNPANNMKNSGILWHVWTDKVGNTRIFLSRYIKAAIWNDETIATLDAMEFALRLQTPQAEQLRNQIAGIAR